jgi:hypothetical protein
MRDQTNKPGPARRESVVETASDRRRSPRAVHRVMFAIRPLLGGGGGRGGLGAPVEVILQDLSITGMGVIHSAALPQGEQFEIPLSRGEADVEPMSLLATVVRCEQLDDGLFSIGFEFNSSAAVVDEGSRQLTGQPAPRD